MSIAYHRAMGRLQRTAFAVGFALAITAQAVEPKSYPGQQEVGVTEEFAMMAGLVGGDVKLDAKRLDAAWSERGKLSWPARASLTRALTLRPEERGTSTEPRKRFFPRVGVMERKVSIPSAFSCGRVAATTVPYWERAFCSG